MSSRRVVVTGIGAVTPLGVTAPETFAAMTAGKTGVARLSFPMDPRFEVNIGAEVRGFDANALLGVKEARRHARFTQLAIVAAREALADAGLKGAGYESPRIASILGVGQGGIEVTSDGAVTLKEFGPRRISPYLLPAAIPNIAVGVLAIEAEARGPCFSIASACASGGHAIGEAFELVRRGTVDAAITGGAEAGVTPVGIAGFERMGALSRRNDEPTRASRPFDRDRDGFVLGEGAGILVLEAFDAAKRRGDPARARRPRRQSLGQQHQEHDGPFDGRGGRGREHRHPARATRGSGASHGEPRVRGHGPAISTTSRR